MTDVTREGQALIDAWLNTGRHVNNAASALTTAQQDHAENSRRLGEWLLPEDAQVGEKIAVWNGDWLFQAEKTDGDPVVTIRKRGKGRMI